MELSKLGRYDIVRLLGKGAMGTVYEAVDPHLQRRVAIKTIAVHGLSDAGVRDYEIRFRTEARSCARLQHPHVVSVYDAGRDGDTAYLVMEYVEGHDLKYHLDHGVRFTLDQTLRLMHELLAALAYAHAQNVVHRDVKPGNVLIEADGRVKLTDFGVARIQDAGDATRTRGLMVGTLKYMSPEQAQGQSVDARTDLFSAGIVLYQLLTGRQPFVGDSEFAIIAQIIGVDPPAPSAIHPALPVAIDAVLACALAKDREQRYPNAQAFDDALALACGLAHDRSTAPPPALPGQVSSAMTAPTVPNFGGPAGMATVTQELELVYWKDVRDSDDPLDLQGFLDRFPAGIYADLARRQLRKLGVVFVGEQTATRVEARVVAAAVDEPQSDGDAQVESGQQQRTQTHRRSRQAISRVVAATALVLFAAAGIGWWFSSKPSMLASSSSAPQPATLLSAPVVPATPAPVQQESPVVDAQAPDAPDLVVAPVQPTVTRTPAAAPAANRSSERAAANVSMTKAEVADPEQACAGRILLGYQICLREQCARPALVGHPLCQQRLAAEQARRQRQTDRN